MAWHTLGFVVVLAVASQAPATPGLLSGTLGPLVPDPAGGPSGAVLRVEGRVTIGGRPTLITLPFSQRTNTVAFRRGMIGVDLDGDGRIDARSELLWANGDKDRLIIAVNGRYVSIESADYASRVVVLREHPREAYRVIDVRPGSTLPDFGFTDFEGRTRRLSEFRGQFLLLDFWGTWCAPCVAEFPHLQAARDQFASRGFEILGLDYEHSASAGDVREFLDARRIPWPNATPESVRDLIEHRFRIFGFPTKILLDPTGRVVDVPGSSLHGAALIPTLAELLRRR